MDVIGPVIVAALENGNDTVGVIDAVDDAAQHPPNREADATRMLHFQDSRTTRADTAKHYTIARGSAMESASHFDS